MAKHIFFFLIVSIGSIASAQVVQNPVGHTVEVARKAGTYYAGRSYDQWTVDINHDGLEDVLVSEKERPDEIDEEREANKWSFNPDERGFDVYIRLPAGGYVPATVIEDGKPVGNGIALDLSHCYVGYVPEVKGYGIVTVEALTVDDPDEPQARHGVLKNQVICYTVSGDQIKRTNLTPQFDAGDKNAIYNKYFSESRRTKVQLQTVTP